MYAEILELIKNKNVVSFDIFDTLLLRNVAQPIDIFKILDRIVKEKFNILNFLKKRVEAEKKARAVSENGEANFDEIYIQLENEIKNKEIVNQIKKLEMEKEIEFIVANPFMKKIFNYCVEKNKTIILISDMYYQEAFIKELLDKCGYRAKIKIYVSSDYRKNKGSGELFNLVQRKEHIKHNEWIHIGDNYNSDYCIPKSLGIDAYNYKNVNSYEDVKYNSVFESIILGIRNNYLYNGNEIEYWKKFGVKYLVPLYIGFTNWIYQMTYNRDNIFFIARDGYILEKVYQLFPNNKYTKYIYCSRNSIQIPSMAAESRDKILKLILDNIDENTSLKKVFNICKLKAKKEYENIIKLYGFNSFNEKVKLNKKYDAFKCVCAVFDDAEEELKKDREMARRYLIQEGLNKFDIINVVDVGWGGSIQESIQRLLNKEIRGYYFGTINVGKHDFFSKSFGYIFDQDNDIYDKKKIFSQVMMYELIFSAPHGSTERYEEKEGKIIPILKKLDDYAEIVDIFQNESLKIIKQIMKYYGYYDTLDKHFCIKFYQDFLDSYNWNDLMKFSMIENDYLIGNDEKYPYVQMLKKELFYENFDKLEAIAEKSLWKGAFIIEGCDTEEKHNTFLSEIMKLHYPELYPSKYRKIARRIIPFGIRKRLKRTYFK